MVYEDLPHMWSVGHIKLSFGYLFTVLNSGLVFNDGRPSQQLLSSCSTAFSFSFTLHSLMFGKCRNRDFSDVNCIAAYNSESTHSFIC